MIVNLILEKVLKVCDITLLIWNLLLYNK
jgi:hypothetical protein